MNVGGEARFVEPSHSIKFTTPPPQKTKRENKTKNL